MDTGELFAETVRKNLPTRFIGQRLVYYYSVASTMTAAREQATQGAPHGTVVAAEMQPAGHGRLGRAWLSPRGNLPLSIVLYPPPAYLPYLVMAAALALADNVKTVTGLTPALKWPNDLLLSGKKLSGILVESGACGEKTFAVVGIGLNVNMHVEEYKEIAATATSLADELGRPVSRLALLRELLVQFERRYLMLEAGQEQVFAEWRARLATIGERVRVQAGQEGFEGTAEDVAGDGSLLLRLADGTLRKIAAGDVTLRNAPGTPG